MEPTTHDMHDTHDTSRRSHSIRSVSLSAIASISLVASPVKAGPASAPKLQILRDSTGAEAVVAPDFGGRVLAFSPAEAGRNLFWNAPADSLDLRGWKNHGGEKTWIGPQNLWPKIKRGASWPPPAHFDSATFSVADAGDGQDGAALSMDSPCALGGDVCPFAVHRDVSLAHGVLSVRAHLVPSGEVPPEDAELPQENGEWHVWSIAQVPWSADIAIRKTGLGRFQGASAFAKAEPDGGQAAVEAFKVDAEASSGKIFFDGDAIAVGYPDGAVVARRVPGEGEAKDYPFPKHGRAQLYTGWHGIREDGGVRYLELEFTAIGRTPLQMEFSFVPGATAAEALQRL